MKSKSCQNLTPITLLCIKFHLQKHMVRVITFPLFAVGHINPRGDPNLRPLPLITLPSYRQTLFGQKSTLGVWHTLEFHKV